MSEPVKPALSAEDWDDLSMDRAFLLQPGDPLDAEGPFLRVDDAAFDPEERHGLAALALHGQPFGFRWEDVDMERNTALNWQIKADLSSGEAARGFQAMADGHTSIADRIEALLRPRKDGE